MNIVTIEKSLPYLFTTIIVGSIAFISVPNDTLNSNKLVSLGICIPVAISAVGVIVFLAMISCSDESTKELDSAHNKNDVAEVSDNKKHENRHRHEYNSGGEETNHTKHKHQRNDNLLYK